MQRESLLDGTQSQPVKVNFMALKVNLIAGEGRKTTAAEGSTASGCARLLPMPHYPGQTLYEICLNLKDFWQ